MSEHAWLEDQHPRGSGGRWTHLGGGNPRRRLAKLHDSTDPKDNGAKVRALLEADGEGHADLYRKATAGPSGQRSDIHVGRIRPEIFGGEDFRVIDTHGGGGHVGWLTRSVHQGEQMWAVHSVGHDGGIRFEGHTNSPAAGADMLVHGEHAAFGRHTSQRISPAKWHPHRPEPLPDRVTRRTGGVKVTGSY